MSQPIWAPSPEAINHTLINRFSENLSKSTGQDLSDYDKLFDFSISNKADFWAAVWDDSGVVGEKGARILSDEDDIANAQFFPDANLNYAENLLSRSGKEEALVFVREDNQKSVWSWDDLHALVSRIQQALIKEGIAKGDRIAGFVPNSPYTIAMMLAVTSLGAIWSSCSPDFGFNGVKDRFGQIEPKLLICADHYLYNGKVFDCLQTATELQEAMPSVQKVIVFPYATDITGDMKDMGLTSLAAFIDQFSIQPVTFTRVPFNSPLFILFSSGTTGLPKCIVHGVGGSLLQHVKEHRLQCDLKPGDRLFYFTTCGWMMWNWKVSALAVGASLVLFDGSPFYPDGYRLSEIVDAENVTHFGTSAKYIDACAKADVKPAEKTKLPNLRAILSTGSPLAPDSFKYIYKDWKSDVCLSSIAGGTDICGCFTGGSPISPVYIGQCQKRQLGMDVQVWDDEGLPKTDGPGELVCASPHPSQPVGFWNDPDGSKYHNAYFAKFENTWHHGDFVEITPEGGAVFFGRSDAVLNPGGVRIGTAEIYRQVERVEEVLEGLVIGQNWDSDVRVVLFVRLRDGVNLDETLMKKIKTEIRTNATPRHVPAIIIAIDDIPRTKSGKITELAVRDIVHGREVKNTASLANPEALELYKDLKELQS